MKIQSKIPASGLPTNRIIFYYNIIMQTIPILNLNNINVTFLFHLGYCSINLQLILFCIHRLIFDAFPLRCKCGINLHYYYIFYHKMVERKCVLAPSVVIDAILLFRGRVIITNEHGKAAE